MPIHSSDILRACLGSALTFSFYVHLFKTSLLSTFSHFFKNFNVQILAHFQQKIFNKKLDIFFVVAVASREGKKKVCFFFFFFFFFQMVSSKGGMRDETDECFVCLSWDLGLGWAGSASKEKKN